MALHSAYRSQVETEEHLILNYVSGPKTQLQKMKSRKECLGEFQNDNYYGWACRYLSSQGIYGMEQKEIV